MKYIKCSSHKLSNDSIEVDGRRSNTSEGVSKNASLTFDAIYNRLVSSARSYNYISSNGVTDIDFYIEVIIYDDKYGAVEFNGTYKFPLGSWDDGFSKSIKLHIDDDKYELGDITANFPHTFPGVIYDSSGIVNKMEQLMFDSIKKNLAVDTKKYIKRKPTKSEINAVYSNIINYINSKLQSNYSYTEEFKLVRAGKVFLDNDMAIYRMVIEDSKGNKITTKVELYYDADEDEWWNESESDVGILRKIYDTYIESI